MQQPQQYDHQGIAMDGSFCPPSLICPFVHRYDEYQAKWIIRFAGPGQWHNKRYTPQGHVLNTDGWVGGGGVDAALDWLDAMAYIRMHPPPIDLHVLPKLYRLQSSSPNRYDCMCRSTPIEQGNCVVSYCPAPATPQTTDQSTQATQTKAQSSTTEARRTVKAKRRLKTLNSTAPTITNPAAITSATTNTVPPSTTTTTPIRTTATAPTSTAAVTASTRPKTTTTTPTPTTSSSHMPTTTTTTAPKRLPTTPVTTTSTVPPSTTTTTPIRTTATARTSTAAITTSTRPKTTTTTPTPTTASTQKPTTTTSKHTSTTEASTSLLATKPTVRRLSRPKTRRSSLLQTTPLTPLPTSQRTPTSKKPAETKKKSETPKPKSNATKKAKVKKQKPTPSPTTVAPQTPSSRQNSATARPRASSRQQQKQTNPPETTTRRSRTTRSTHEGEARDNCDVYPWTSWMKCRHKNGPCEPGRREIVRSVQGLTAACGGIHEVEGALCRPLIECKFPDISAPTIKIIRSETSTKPTTRVTRYIYAPTNKASRGKPYVQSTTRSTLQEQTIATSTEQQRSTVTRTTPDTSPVLDIVQEGHQSRSKQPPIHTNEVENESRVYTEQATVSLTTSSHKQQITQPTPPQHVHETPDVNVLHTVFQPINVALVVALILGVLAITAKMYDYWFYRRRRDRPHYKAATPESIQRLRDIASTTAPLPSPPTVSTTPPGRGNIPRGEGASVRLVSFSPSSETPRRGTPEEIGAPRNGSPDSAQGRNEEA